jgi:prevent-host-death family protein
MSGGVLGSSCVGRSDAHSFRVDWMGAKGNANMLKVSITEAKARLYQLLREVEAGEIVAITRRGRQVARLVPAPKSPDADAFRVAIARWRKARKGIRLNGLKVKDLINEGRR